MYHNSQALLVYEVGDEVYYPHLIARSSQYGKGNTVIIHKGIIKTIILEAGAHDLHRVETLTGSAFNLTRDQIYAIYANAYNAARKML